MSIVNFIKQTESPAFPKILWNRPISRAGAGRLLLVGGYKDKFSDIQALYQLTLAAGIGECKVVMPDSLRRLLADVPDTIFVPSSPSGSLGKGALAEILYLAENFDAIAIGADLSNNSQTAILVESLLTQLSRPVVLFGDALSAIKHDYRLAAHNPDRLIILTMQQLFKLAGGLKIALSIRPDDGAIKKVAVVTQVSSQIQANILLSGREIIASAESQISLTSSASAMDFFTPATAAVTSVFWLQNRSNHFEGLTTAAWILRETREKLTKPSEEVLTTTEIAKAIEKIIRD